MESQLTDMLTEKSFDSKDSPASNMRSERRWVFGFAMVVMLITTIPYVIGFATQGDEWRFTGFVFGVEDGNSYIAKMLSGTAGAWLFRTPYTAYPQSGALMFFPYILLGKLASAPALHDQLVVLYHLFRFGAGLLSILATYDFLSLYIQRVQARQLGLILITLGGGIGWFFLLFGEEQILGSLPLEFYSPETFGFLAIYGLPHLALARALLLWTLTFYLRLVMQQEFPGEWKVSALKMSALWLGAGLAQPLTLVVIGLLITLHLLAIIGWSYYRSRSLNNGDLTWQCDFSRWKQLVKWFLYAAIGPTLVFLYNFGIMFFDPFISAWSAQNIIRSPHPLHYLIAYGILLPLIVTGARWLVQENPAAGLLPVLWVVALPALAYAPFNLQRRLPEGIWAAIILLAIIGYERKRQRFGLFLFALTLPSAVILLVGGCLTTLHPSEPAFRSVHQVAVFEFLSQDALPDDVALAGYATGNALPAWAPMRVVIGHGPESVNLAELQNQVAEFFQQETSDSQRQEIIRRLGVRYILWGVDERRLGDWRPDQALYLVAVYRDGDYQVYETLR